MLQELWQVLQTYGEDSTRTKKAMNSNPVAMARLTGFVNSKIPTKKNFRRIIMRRLGLVVCQ